jgi:hypothetical protein
MPWYRVTLRVLALDGRELFIRKSCPIEALNRGAAIRKFKKVVGKFFPHSRTRVKRVVGARGEK